MVVFLSQKMSGLSDEEVFKVRKAAEEFIKSKLPDEDIEIIDNYVYPEAPENAHNLWYLGRSIQRMAEADTIFFTSTYENSRGGLIEKHITELYDLNVLNERIGNMPESE